MVWTSSVKAQINGMLLDEEFLKNNVLHFNQQKVGTHFEKKVLSLYKPIKYQDKLQTSIKIKSIRMKLENQSDEGTL